MASACILTSTDLIRQKPGSHPASSFGVQAHKVEAKDFAIIMGDVIMCTPFFIYKKFRTEKSEELVIHLYIKLS